MALGRHEHYFFISELYIPWSGWWVQGGGRGVKISTGEKNGRKHATPARTILAISEVQQLCLRQPYVAKKQYVYLE